MRVCVCVCMCAGVENGVSYQEDDRRQIFPSLRKGGGGWRSKLQEREDDRCLTLLAIILGMGKWLGGSGKVEMESRRD